MTLLFAIEASKPDGTMFRLAFGWTLVLPLATWLTHFTRML